MGQIYKKRISFRNTFTFNLGNISIKYIQDVAEVL